MTLYGACRGANRQNMVFAGTAVGYASGSNPNPNPNS
jgi:hypothetical protein